jgi:uncharacterized protein YdeI (YjbR/CyaY-like superfamily)
MEQSKEVYCSNRSEWRNWLAKNSKKEKEVWLIYYKRHTEKPRVPYNDAVEEAICFGWIDSTIQRVDVERYRQKFTPRNRNSNWSAHNVRRANKMIREGKMTKEGLVLFEEWQASNKKPISREPTQGKPVPPDDLIRAMKENRKALDNYNKMAPSHKRNYILWITDAKKEETRLRRIDKAVMMLEKNIKSFM